MLFHAQCSRRITGFTSLIYAASPLILHSAFMPRNTCALLSSNQIALLYPARFMPLHNMAGAGIQGIIYAMRFHSVYALCFLRFRFNPV
jgi:hypothetical protein